MKKWTTYIYAVSPLTGLLTKYCGPKITAPTRELAQEWCELNGMGYCTVVQDEVAYEVSHEVDNN
ncbi:hypothetical protein LX66_3570 [Chitinophaga japonensis]|uniref:Uncharacterized protein n=1 Tax=Chitinophaga japonensis TaxID=104662 RepID=A0A562SZQ8_CHIJA|nr:hypothetical protein LX66_3570 [Chitinophaga japonensis]